MANDAREYMRVSGACLIILAAVALTSALIYTRQILVPFVISIFVYAVTAPLAKWLRLRLKLSIWVSIALTFLIFLFATAGLVFFLVESIGDFARSANTYMVRVDAFSEWLNARLAEWGVEINSSVIFRQVRTLPVFSYVASVTGATVAFVSNVFLVLIFVFFLLAGQGAGTISNPLAREIQNSISRYVVIKLLLSVTTGVLTWIVLALCNVDLAFMFGVLALLLNFIPTIGSIIGTILPLPVLLLQFGLGWQFAVVLSLTGVVQLVIGNVIEPRMLGSSMDLHPVTVMLFLMFWGLVWGIPGMFLAVPITAIIKIALMRIESTRGIAELLAGRWPEAEESG